MSLHLFLNYTINKVPKTCGCITGTLGMYIHTIGLILEVHIIRNGLPPLRHVDSKKGHMYR